MIADIKTMFMFNCRWGTNSELHPSVIAFNKALADLQSGACVLSDTQPDQSDCDDAGLVGDIEFQLTSSE